MDECPHCGEPLRENTESCPYCGSDYETGWNPDAEYLGLELPDDDLDTPPSRQAPLPELDWERILGALIIIAALAAFLWTGFQAHRLVVLPCVVLLVVCYAVYCRWVKTRA